MVEQQRYDVIESLPGGVEIRSYPEHQVISVDVRAGLSDAGNIGFRPLVNYISGNNQASQQIAMTAPVLQEPTDAEGFTVSFVLPYREDGTVWPEPVDSRVRVESKPQSLVAARQFRGYWRESSVLDEERRLLVALETSDYRPAGAPYFARYNPPSMPGFLRRNEVLVAVEHNS
jgi:hypothetical protein